MINFDVHSRFTGKVQFTAEIDCDDDAPRSVKIGLAVKWGIKTGANLSCANLSGAYLSGADLSGAYLSGANLSCADLSGANLSGANLSCAYLSCAYLSGANLSGANLSGAYLSCANLSCANLSGAYLSGAYLSGAYLSGANLSGAYLSGAYLSGADLSGAKIICKVAQIRRDDGYEFIAFALDDGRLFVRAGCRSMTVDDFRAHVAKEYPDTPKAIETLAILDFIDARHAATSLVQA